MEKHGLRKTLVGLLLVSLGIALLAGGVFCYVNAQEEASPVRPRRNVTQAAEIPIPELVFCDIMPYFPS